MEAVKTNVIGTANVPVSYTHLDVYKRQLMDLVPPSDINKNLFILPGGAVPPNPTELLARDGLEKAIETLKVSFDYVILDTAPVGMVTDTLLIGRTADLSIYVCRADYTRKAEFSLINELSENNKLPNLCIAINGLDLQKKKYGYYYGYGKYGKYYGYGTSGVLNSGLRAVKSAVPPCWMMLETLRSSIFCTSPVRRPL